MEGPSLVILREEIAHLRGQMPTVLSGNAKIDWQALRGRRLTQIRTWGKQLLLSFEGRWLRVHFLLFGSYRLNDLKDQEPRFLMQCGKDALAFYSCSVRHLEDGPAGYDWSVDVLSRHWDGAAALAKLQRQPQVMVCDALMDQDIFAGSGNIVKNEVAYRLGLHPETLLGNLSRAQLLALVREVRHYCQQFYRWKKAHVLKQHWQVFRKPACPACGTKVTMRHTGKRHRRSFYCPHCQVLAEKAPRRAVVPRPEAPSPNGLRITGPLASPSYFEKFGKQRGTSRRIRQFDDLDFRSSVP